MPIQKKFATIDLFSGCGGMSLGFMNAGFNVLAAFDNWDSAIEVYKKNFHHPIHKLDLSDDKNFSFIKTNFSPDFVIGGPPCQDFSSAGKRNEDLGRADLTVSFAKIVSLLRPKWFVMENVERILKSEALPKAKLIFRKAGYGLSEKVLDASFCGVPQTRKRFFLVGELDQEDNFLNYYLDESMSKKPLTLRDYFGDTLGIKYYYRHPRSYARRGVFSIDEPSPTIRGVNRPLPKGYKIHPGDPVNDFHGIRPLTTQERALVQTFPKDFQFIGNKTQIEQMIGNAIPVKLVEYVAKAILMYMRDRENNSIKLPEEQYSFIG